MAKKQERLISLIIALHERGPLTLEEIQETVIGYHKSRSEEAFRRMFNRDKEYLNEQGIRILYESNRYHIDYSFNLNEKLNLIQTEKNLLADILAEILSFDDVVNSQALRSAVYKVAIRLGIYPRVIEREPMLRFALNITEEEQFASRLIEEAIDKKKKVVFEYRAYDADSYKDFEVNPILLSLRNGEWYLVAEVNKAVRFFKLKRIRNLRVSNKKAEIEITNIDEILKELYKKPWQYDVGDEVEVEIKCPINMKSLIERKFNGETYKIVDKDCYLKLIVKSPERFFLHFAPYLSIAEIVKPDFLRQMVKQNLCNVLESL
ncbi:MAG: WYL domain-containing protein [Actinobacteria bacterium]|nr:WYL domain-containing protein [Actinomycetota bacterium]